MEKRAEIIHTIIEHPYLHAIFSGRFQNFGYISKTFRIGLLGAENLVPRCEVPNDDESVHEGVANGGRKIHSPHSL